MFKVELKDESRADSAYREPLMIPQAETKEILDETLLKYNGKKVKRPVIVSSLEQDESCVSVCCAARIEMKREFATGMLLDVTVLTASFEDQLVSHSTAQLTQRISSLPTSEPNGRSEPVHTAS